MRNRTNNNFSNMRGFHLGTSHELVPMFGEILECYLCVSHHRTLPPNNLELLNDSAIHCQQVLVNESCWRVTEYYRQWKLLIWNVLSTLFYWNLLCLRWYYQYNLKPFEFYCVRKWRLFFCSRWSFSFSVLYVLAQNTFRLYCICN